ncbi:MAG: tyrosine-type recombinase/integrase [Burkholderiaceae bacterium]
MKLTDAKLRGLKAPGKHFDGGGLYLEVTPAGGRYWRQKYRFGGKEKRLAFGVYPEVSLKEARERRDEARKIIERGDDPSELKKAARAKADHEARNTFEAVARDWLTHQAGAWTPAHAGRVQSTLEADVFPHIGRRPMAQIKPREVIDAVKAIEARGAGEVADRVLKRIRAVFRHAMTHERIETNPLSDMKPGEVLKPRQTAHRLALTEKDLPGFLAKLDAYEGDPTTRHALRLLMLTALRPGELRGLRWAEVDTDAAEIRIPGERMKMRAPHVVPLSKQALGVLEAMKPLSAGRELVFPSPYYPGASLSENTLNGALARMGFKGYATAHGFRALFSTTANEHGHDADVIERQLAHRERNKVRAAYHRSEYLRDRARLMQWWADFLDSKRGGKVVPFGRKAKA